MKTFVSTNNHTKCENTSKQSFWPWPWASPALSGSAHSHLSIIKPLKTAVSQVARAFRATSNTLRVNHRLYLAIVFMLVLAPLANVGYQLFDPSVRGSFLYYENAYYLLFILSPWMSLVLFCSGIFLLFPAGSRRAWFIAIPLISAFFKIIWLTTVSSNAEFHQVVPLYFLLPAASVAFVWLFLLDWLMARKYHGIDALVARMDGLFQTNMDPKDKLQYLRKTWIELKNFNKQF